MLRILQKQQEGLWEENRNRNSLFHPLRHWVISAAAPRVTAQDAAQAEVKSLERSILPEGFERVLRAGWSKATGWRFERRYAQLIELDKKDERRGKNLFYYDSCFSHAKRPRICFISPSITEYCAISFFE